MTASDSSPPHLVSLPGHDDWALWRIVGVRGAGFPARLSHELASAAVADGANELLEAEAKLHQRQEEVEAAVGRLLDQLSRLGADGRRRALKVGRLVRKHRVDEPKVRTALGDEVVDAWAAAAGAREEAEKRWRMTYDEEVKAQSKRLAELAADPRLNRAVIWQNRGAWGRTFRHLRKVSKKRNSRQRQNEEFLANYVARYSVKNDTIGFFGPMGWGRFDDGPDVVRARPGPTLISGAGIYVEHWALLKIAATFESDRAIRQHLVIRRTPHYRLAGGDIVLPHARFPVSDAFRVILERLQEAEETGSALAEALATLPQFEHPDDVLDHVEQLVGMKVLTWGFHLPATPDALDDLLAQVDALPAAPRDALRRRLQGFVGAVEALRALDEPAPKALDAAMGAAEKAYMELTGADAATRDVGQTYAGRTIVFEDCLRDLELSLGRPMVEELTPTLACVGQSLRWLSDQAAARIREKLDAVFQATAGDGGDEVDAASYQLRLLRGADDLTASIGELHAEYRRKWVDLLGLDESQRSQELDPGEILRRVADAFPAERPGWPDAMHHNPDVLIAAESLEAVRRGDYQLVLGEVHPGAVTILTWVFQQLCPQQDEVFAAQNHDMAGLAAAVTRTKVVGPTSSRLQPAWIGTPDTTLIAPLEPLPSTRDDATLLSDYVVERHDGELTLRRRDADARYPLLDTLGPLFSRLLVQGFGILDYERHRPRIRMGRVILSREEWRVPVSDLEMADDGDRAAAYIRFRRWAVELGLPRFSFYRLPAALENKPMYLDRDSLISTSIFLGQARRCAASDLADEDKSLVLTEMLPQATEAWLEDGAGEAYTSEFRLTLLDRRGRDTVAPGSS